jgi:hypothetical protein
LSPALTYDRPRYFRLPPVIDDPVYGEEVITFTQQRITLWLLLPGAAVIGTALIFLIACFPATAWHLVYPAVIKAPTGGPAPGGVHTRLSLPGLRVLVVVLAGLAWLVAIGFFSTQFAEWRYSVYVLTNVRLIRRFVNFDWHNRGGIVRRRFQVIRKEVLLRDIGEVTHGVLDGIQIKDHYGSLLMSINHIPRTDQFIASIEQARAAQLYSS